MRPLPTAPVFLVALLLVACGEAPTPVETLSIAEARQLPVLSNAEYLATERYAAEDQTLGRSLYNQCLPCHSLDPEPGPGPGPGLHGIFGREAASLPGFAYSGALLAAELRWTPAALDAWLAKPLGFIPGSQMAFAGLSDADDRRALIAYLLVATDAASN